MAALKAFDPVGLRGALAACAFLVAAAWGLSAWAQDAQPAGETVREKIEEAKKAVGWDKPPADEAERMMRNLFDLDVAGDELEALAEAASKVKTTDDDIAGLDALCRMAWAEAEAKFRQSIAAAPGRPFPHYFLGVAAFERGDFKAAREAFGRVVALEPAASSAHLLARLSELCDGRKDLTPARLLMLYAQAFRDTGKALGLDKEEFSLALALLPPLVRDPVLYRSWDCIQPVAVRRMKAVEEDATRATTPDAEIVGVLAFTPAKGTVGVAERLAAKFPANRDLQVFSFMMKYFGAQVEKKFPVPEGFAADLDKAMALDGENGALMLLKIPYRRNARLEDPEPPLTAEDVAILHAAMRSPRFCAYASWKVAETRALRAKEFGSYAHRLEMTVQGGPMLLSFFQDLMRRSGTTFEENLIDGERDLAMALWRDVQRLADRMVEDNPSLLTRLVSDTIARASCLHALQSFATVAPGDVPEEILARLDAVLLRGQTASSVGRDLHVMEICSLPLRRLSAAYETAVEGPRGLVDAEFAEEVERGRECACDDARETLKRQLDRARVVPMSSNAYASAALLGVLKDTKAVDLLEELATSKDASAQAIARRALAKIRQR
jgi:hypothetical protein